MAEAESSNHHKVDEVTPLLPRQRQGSWENDAKKPAKKPSPWYIIIPLFSLTFCFGAIFAPMIQFYTVVFCYKYYQSQTGDSSDIPLENCAIPEVQAIVSEAQAIIMFLTYGSTLLVASYYGALSDRKGRRLVLKISGIGNILLMVCYIATIKYQNIFGISLLFVAPVVRGLMAGDSILIAAAHAYISDVTTPSERTIVFGRMMAAFFLGATLGPSAASILIKQTGTITSIFYMVLIINVIFELYTFFILPESHDFAQFQQSSHHKEAQSFLQRINVFSALNILYRASSKHANRYALPLITGTEFLLTMIAIPPTLLYAMLKFGWTAYEGGLYISLGSFSKLIILVFLLPFLSKLFHKNKASLDESDVIANPKIIEEEFSDPAGAPSTSSPAPTVVEEQDRSEKDIRHSIIFDTWMIRAGMGAEVICFIVFGLVTSSKAFTLNAVLQSFAALALPSLRSLMTTLVTPSEVGELLGAIAVVESVAMITSQLTINTIYSASVGTMPQLIFFVCAALAGLGLALAFLVKPAPTTTNTDDA